MTMSIKSLSTSTSVQCGSPAPKLSKSTRKLYLADNEWLMSDLERHYISNKIKSKAIP